jgi:hypothetical protein
MPFRGKATGTASRIEKEAWHSYSTRKLATRSRLNGYRGKWMLIGSSFNSSTQAVPPTLLSNFIDGSRIT